MSVNIYSSTVPHKYRNRFLRDGGSNVSIIGGGSSSSSSSGGGGSGFNFEPHYFWGQYFDDTQDVSGDLTGVGSITASGVINASGITLSDFVISPTVSGTNAVFDTGVFYSGITSNSAIINNISGDTVVLSQSLTAPTISGNSIIGNNISGTNASITSLTATAITSNTINVTNKLTTNQLEAVSGYIKTLLSDEITVDYLTVTKAAHFFKLLIDEIKATQGQIIITPCNAVIDKVETVSGNYRCYFRAKDDDREIYNNFEVNDQVVCQTFNVATGVSYNVSNTYYWRLCVATGTTSTTIDGETVECHYIDLSDSDKDSFSISAPTSGDNVVQLGNRNDSTRQAAIIISAYNQQFLDPTIKAPSIVQYQGINDYSLQNHRKNVISKDFNEFVGNFKTSTGDDIEELIEDVTSGITAYLHTAWSNSADGSVDFTKNPSGGQFSYVGVCSNNIESDENLVYTDYSWTYIKGEEGDNAEFYRLVPVIEKAIVDKNGTLGVQFSYQIAHVSGSSVTTVTATTSDYWVRVKPNNSSTYYNLSTNTTTPNYTNASFITNYHKQTSKPTYFTVYLVSGSSAVVKDQKTVSVIFDAGATLEVTDEINATVQGHSETISSHTNSIATLNANYSAITTTVESNTNNISNLSGTVTSHTNSISQLQQTSSSLTSTVSAHTNQINSISGTVTGHTSQISTIQQNLTGITSTVASLEDTVDNLSVGGANLIRETKYLNTDYCYVNGTRTKNGYQSFTYAYKYKYSSDGDYVDVLGWNDKLTLEPNTWYTLSFYAKGSGQIKSFLYPNAVASGYNSSNNTTTSRDGIIETNYTTTWKRYWITWKTASSVSGSKSLLVARLYSGYVYIAAPKFEKGTMATDWSPHPEDFESDINAISGTVTSHTASISQLEQTSSSLTSTVSSHTQSISQLQQTSTSLTSTVQSLQNTVSQIELTKKVTVDATNLSESYAYPVVIALGGDNPAKPIRCNVSRTLVNSYGVPSYATHSNGFVIDVDWTTKASGWGTNRVNDYWSENDNTRFINDYKVNWVTSDDIRIVGSIGQVTEVSQEIVYVRGGSKYDISTSKSDATITLYSNGYNWSSNGYSQSRPVINISSLVIPIQDTKTYSEIVQTATNIELNVYDELKNKTGINVSAGTITLDADNTTIVGNLNLTDTNNGLTMYDNESVPRVNIQPTNIGTKQVGKYNWFTTSKSETGHSDFYLSLPVISLGTISSGYDITIYYANINMWATNGSSTVYPSSSYYHPYLVTQIYCNGTLVKDFGYKQTSYNGGNGEFYLRTPLTFTTKSSGTYTVKFQLSSSYSLSTSYTLYGMVNANIQWDLKAQTQIYTDGMLSQSAPNNYLEIKPDKVEIRQGTVGLRLISDNNNPSANMFKGIQTIVGFRGSSPSVYPNWLPFHNYTPTFSTGDGKRNFSYQKINNINQYKYAYQISPYNDYGTMIINSGAYNADYTAKQDTWVILPPLNFTGENGTTNQLPIGYSITIINNTIGNESTNVYVVPSVSSQNTGIIIDSNRDSNSYTALNGNQTYDTYIYVGSWSNGTSNIMYWRSIHDTQ